MKDEVLIGYNQFRNKTTPIKISGADRLRHFYTLGKTGTGKSTLFQNLCLQDIFSGRGVCFVDPHGESINWLMSRIPENRLEDVILFDPANQEFPIGLNLLEANSKNEADFVVAELIEIFYALFDPNKQGIIGPQFEHWLRNAGLTIMAGPEGGSLLEIPKLFMDKKFEMAKRKFLRDPLVIDFWAKQIASTSDFHRSEMLNYFSSKFGHFQNNKLMRGIIGQNKSGFSFNEAIAKEKIILINLSKGQIGDINARMLGLIAITKLYSAILQRASIPPEQRQNFYLYVDEFHNLVTSNFASILSESRKFGLSLNITNQYFNQLPRHIQDAVLGNVGSLLCFTLGAEDAEALGKEFLPFSYNDLTNLEKNNFYLKLLIEGRTSEPFSGSSMPPLGRPQAEMAELIRHFSDLAYGSPKVLIEKKLNLALQS